MQSTLNENNNSSNSNTFQHRLGLCDNILCLQAQRYSKSHVGDMHEFAREACHSLLLKGFKIGQPMRYALEC